MNILARLAVAAPLAALLVGCANGEIDEEDIAPAPASEAVGTATQAYSVTCPEGSSPQCVGQTPGSAGGFAAAC